MAIKAKSQPEYLPAFLSQGHPVQPLVLMHSCYHGNLLDKFPLFLQGGGKHMKLLPEVLTELADLVLNFLKHYRVRE